MEFVAIHVLAQHRPTVGQLGVRCSCGWSAVTATPWYDWICHVPRAASDGDLLLTREDMRELKAMHITVEELP